MSDKMRPRRKQAAIPAEISGGEGQPTWVRATSVTSIQNPVQVVARNKKTFTANAAFYGGPPGVPARNPHHILVQDEVSQGIFEWIKIWWEE